ncbi:hypothetical protein OROGR_026981 [Orobanche gracilis]
MDESNPFLTFDGRKPLSTAELNALDNEHAKYMEEAAFCKAPHYESPEPAIDSHTRAVVNELDPEIQEVMRKRSSWVCEHFELVKEKGEIVAYCMYYGRTYVAKKKNKIDELTDCIKAKVYDNQLDEEAEKYTQELGKMISAVIQGWVIYYNTIFWRSLLRCSSIKNTRSYRSHAAIILQYVVACWGNMEVVMELITPSIIVNLMHSTVCEVQKQALLLLRNIAFGIPNSFKSKIVLEEASESLNSLIDSFNESTVRDLLYIGSKTLALACEVYLDFSPDELESVLQALMKLLKYKRSYVLAYACSGIMFLCNKKQTMVVEEQQLGTLVDRLIELIDSESRVKTIAGLTALGSIVRWGSDSNVEVIIKKDTLLSLECLLGEDDKYYVKNACWIISNITARKEYHIKAVIDSGLIKPLVDVVESYDLLDVKREAARAISNAIYGLGLGPSTKLGICLRNILVKPFGDLLKVV